MNSRHQYVSSSEFNLASMPNKAPFYQVVRIIIQVVGSPGLIFIALRLSSLVRPTVNSVNTVLRWCRCGAMPAEPPVRRTQRRLFGSCCPPQCRPACCCRLWSATCLQHRCELLPVDFVVVARTRHVRMSRHVHIVQSVLSSALSCSFT